MEKINRRKQNESSVVVAIEQFTKTHNYGPSFRDLSQITGISLGAIHAICRDLRITGVVDYIDNVARTLRLKERNK